LLDKGFYSNFSTQETANNAKPVNEQVNEGFSLNDVSNKSYIESHQIVVDKDGANSNKGSYAEEIHLKSVPHERRPLTEKEYFSSPSKNIYSRTTLENVEEKGYTLPLPEVNSGSIMTSQFFFFLALCFLCYR
jgi:hypothetical protein